MALLFPHENIRKFQSDFISVVEKAISLKKHAIIHAPTGLGKTAASLSPALTHLLESKREELKIFFLTSRNTQHLLASDTLSRIKNKHSLDIQFTDLVGKKNLCAQDSVLNFHTSEFFEFCKAMREDEKCEFYSNLKDSKGKFSFHTMNALSKIKKSGKSRPKKYFPSQKKTKSVPMK